MAERSVGEEVYAVLCARIAAEELPTDVRGRHSNDICHRGESPVDDTPARLVALHDSRARLISALDAGLGASGLDDALGGFLAELLPFYELPDERLPGLTRSLADMLGDLLQDTEALEALSRMDGRQGYRPLQHALGAAQVTFRYPELHAFLGALLGAIDEEGSAQQPWDALLSALALELADYQPDAGPAGESTLDVTRALLFQRPASDAFVPFEASYLVDRAVDGRVQASSFCAEDGCPLLEAALGVEASALQEEGGLLGDGEPKQVTAGERSPTPFQVAGEVPGVVMRDLAGRALDEQSGAPLYRYADASQTFMAVLARELSPLFAANAEDRNAFMDLMHGLPLVLGEQAELSQQYGQASHRYQGHRTEASPVLDLLQMVSVLGRSPDFADALVLFERLMTEHEQPLADLMRGLLDARALAAASDAQLVGPHEMWDELLYWVELLARTSREPGETQLEGVLRGMADERAKHFGDLMALMMRYRDNFEYDPDNINDLPRGQFVTPVDRSQPDTRDNRSILERSLMLLGEINGQTGLCNKRALLFSECGVMDYEDVGRVFGGAMSEAWRLDLGSLDRLGSLSNSLVEQLMRIDGLDEYPDPPALVRMLFSDVGLVDLLLDPLLIRHAPDDSQEYWLKRVYAGTIEAWEVPVSFADGSRVSFWDVFRPVAEAFNKHDYDPLDEAHVNDEHKWFIYMELGATLARHYGAPGGDHVSARGQPFFNEQTNAVSFEGLLADMIASPGMVSSDCDDGLSAEGRCWVSDETLGQHGTNLGLFAKLHGMLRVLDDIDMGQGRDGIDVVSGLAELLLNPHKACDPGGDGLARPDGTGACDDPGAPYAPVAFRRSTPDDRYLRYTLGTHWDGSVQAISAAQEPLVQDAQGRPVVAHHEDADLDGGGQGRPYLQRRYVSPMQVMARALNDIDDAFAQSAAADATTRLEHWRSARSVLVDQLLATDGERFSNATGKVLVLELLSFFRERLAVHDTGVCAGSAAPLACGQACASGADCGGGLSCESGICASVGDRDVWLEGLVPRGEQFLRTPLLAAFVDLVDALQGDPVVQREFAGFLRYLFSADESHESLDTTLIAVLDFVQVLQDDENVVPTMRGLSGLLARDSRPFVAGEGAALSVQSGTTRRATDLVHDILQVDSRESMVKLLGNLVVSHEGHLGGREAPLETILDVTARVNRASPLQDAGRQMSSEDYRRMLQHARGFLSDERRGLERIFDIVQNRDL